MAIEQELNRPKVLDGPPIAGKPTTAIIFSTAELKQTSFLPSLLKTINTAYYASETYRPELGMSTTDRLGSIEEFFATFGTDAESFIVVISYPGSSHTIATASVRRYMGPSKDSYSPWLRRVEVEGGAEEWELKLMATEPSAQGSGIATFMMNLMEAEVMRRFQAKRAAAGEVGAAKKVRMVLCTPAELLAPFYLKRGYQKDYELPRGAPYRFHIWFGSKTLCVGEKVSLIGKESTGS